MKKYFIFILLLVSIASSPESANAAGYGLSVYPPLLRVNIKPGKSISQAFRITNLTTDDKFFVARLIPFTDSDLSGNPEINLLATAPWVSYFNLVNSNIKLGEPFIIKGNSSEQLILNLTVPVDAPVRDLYATLLISTYSNLSGVSYQGSLVSATTGSNLIITVSSNAFPATLLRVENISPVSGAIFKLGSYYLADNITPITFQATAQNTGSFVAETKGIFRVTSFADDPIYLEGILPVNVLSKTQRSLQNSDGTNFVYSPGLNNIGLYRFTFLIKTDNANAENSVSIILVPFKITVGLLFALSFVFVIFRTAQEKKDRGTIDITISK